MSVFGTAGPGGLSSAGLSSSRCDICGEQVVARQEERLWFIAQGEIPRRPPHVAAFFDAYARMVHYCYRPMDEIELAALGDHMVEHGVDEINPAIEPRHVTILRARLAAQ